MATCDICGHSVYPPDESGQDRHVSCLRARYQHVHPNEDWAAIEADMDDDWDLFQDGRIDAVDQVTL